ncbi:MAG: hypothetical protein F6K54_09395 [Okeania sp. SIO3B5]|nr:hypothetical protein [Okeania sp. SIO3B5]
MFATRCGDRSLYLITNVIYLAFGGKIIPIKDNSYRIIKVESLSFKG